MVALVARELIRSVSPVDDAATLKAVCPLFAVARAGIVRGEDEEEEGENGGGAVDEEKRDQEPPQRGCAPAKQWSGDRNAVAERQTGDR